MAQSAHASFNDDSMTALFVSDVHLQESLPATTAAFLRFLQRDAVRSQALYVLGDLFEYWAGDDDIDAPFNRQIIDALRAVRDGGTELFWIGGNRDFLINGDFAKATGCTMLKDGSVVVIAGEKIVLAHGDAQCTDDIDYIAFRNQVRKPEWQERFLAQPLTQRKSMIDGMREQSRIAQRDKTAQIMDVNPHAIARLFNESGASVMIHGHTHRPAIHRAEDGHAQLMRIVLPDWHCEDEDSTERRGGWVGVNDDGRFLRFDCDGNLLR